MITYNQHSRYHVTNLLFQSWLYFPQQVVIIKIQLLYFATLLIIERLWHGFDIIFSYLLYVTCDYILRVSHSFDNRFGFVPDEDDLFDKELEEFSDLQEEFLEEQRKKFFEYFSLS